MHECPDYAEKAVCHNKGCHLPHIDRAGQIRKLYANMADTNKSGPVSSGDDNNDSDLQSEEEDYDEIDSDDVDSDGLDDEFIQLSSHDLNNHALSAQQDFIEFDSP